MQSVDTDSIHIAASPGSKPTQPLPSCGKVPRSSAPRMQALASPAVGNRGAKAPGEQASGGCPPSKPRPHPLCGWCGEASCDGAGGKRDGGGRFTAKSFLSGDVATPREHPLPATRSPADSLETAHGGLLACLAFPGELWGAVWGTKSLGVQPGIPLGHDLWAASSLRARKK